MKEAVASQILLDFEAIALLALLVGLLVYTATRRLRTGFWGRPGAYISADLGLVMLPAAFFLTGPLFMVAVDGNGEIGPSSEASDASANQPADTLDAIETALTQLFYFAFIGLIIYFILVWLMRRSLVSLFGLDRLSFPLIVVWSVVGAMLSLAICGWGFGELSRWWLDPSLGSLDEQEPVEALRQSTSPLHLSLSAVMACIAAPIVEEFLFRGYFYGVIKQYTGPIFAMIVIGALFAVVHGNLPALLPLWAFSIILTLTYEWTRCLWVPVGIHAVFNLTNIILLLGSGE
ncbi:MAG: type II CAAX endopeptidase family protein [Verrucomicrobiota bacterium]